jgi:ATP-dependent DNA helicase RecQ
LAKTSFKLLYAAPERFFVQNERELQALQSIRPAFLVVDEAHCIDRWGRDFRPEYGRLREVRKALGSPPVFAFTATPGVEMQRRILASLGIEGARVFVRDVDRPNISLVRWKAWPAERPQIIAQLSRLRLPIGGKVMIFVPTRKIGEALQNTSVIRVWRRHFIIPASGRRGSESNSQSGLSGGANRLMLPSGIGIARLGCLP